MGEGKSEPWAQQLRPATPPLTPADCIHTPIFFTCCDEGLKSRSSGHAHLQLCQVGHIGLVCYLTSLN